MNMEAIEDKQWAPSLACQQRDKATAPNGTSKEVLESPLYTPEQEELFERRFCEGYDLPDPEYEVWMRINHPIDVYSEPRGDTVRSATSGGACSTAMSSGMSSSDALSELLVLPEPKPATRGRGEKAVNSMKTVCITDAEVLEEMKSQEAAKLEAEKLKKEKQLERERKKIEREEKKKAKQLEREKKKE